MNDYNHYITYFWLTKQFGNYEQTEQIGGANKVKWKTFHHNGVLFPPEYVPHGTELIYNNERIKLNSEAEEIATIYSKYTTTEYMKNKTFNSNFWNDWKKIARDKRIQSLNNCDFSLFYNYVLREKEKRDARTPEEKEQEKNSKNRMEEKYKIAYVDGKPQPVGNFRMEPPGIFIGRGCHPKLGKIKRRIYPEDITLNLSKDASIPLAPDGHKWGKIINDNTVEWLASWKDEISKKTKYVWLAANSDMKGENDRNKYDKARKLKKHIKRIRETNNENLSSNDATTRQIATALYFIDNLALRVGNEKGQDEADTVGVTSLRVEHIKLDAENYITLDFLGKDSIHYVNTIQVPNTVYGNLEEFMSNKREDESLFDRINSNDLNKYLQSFMNDLTAKVFRTYNASHLFQEELNKITKKYDKYELNDKINILLDEFNRANAKVAQLCNHQKNVSKSFDNQLDKINKRIKELKDKIKKIAKNDKKKKEKTEKIKNDIKKLMVKKELKVEMKNISLGTSKINYIDPRITIAFMKKHNLPIDKIFSKTLQDKFKWSFEVDSNWTF